MKCNFVVNTAQNTHTHTHTLLFIS